jgi:DNA-binding IscR family transcriptional regulator
VDCSLRSLWKSLQVAVDDVLRKTTLQDLLRDEKQLTVLVTQLASAGMSMPVKRA